MKIGKKTKVTRELTRQEKNRQNNIRRTVVAAIAAVIVFIALVIIEKSILNQERTEQVYQVIKDIDSGTKITESNFDNAFALKEVQVSLIPEGYITDKEDMIDKFVNRNYKANDIITSDGITDTQALYKNGIKNPIEISFSVENLGVAVSGTVREGDYINIYGMRQIDEDKDITEVDATYTFKHVYVEQAFNGSGQQVKADKLAEETETEETEDTVVTMFNIVLDEDDVPLFNEMIENCSIKLAKLQYDTDQDYQVFLKKTNKETGYQENKEDGTENNDSDIVVPNYGDNTPSDTNETGDGTDTSDENQDNRTTQQMIDDEVNGRQGETGTEEGTDQTTGQNGTN